VTFEEMETALRDHLEAFPAVGSRRTPGRSLPPGLSPGRADRRVWGHPETRGFGEPLIDLEEDESARGFVFGLLADMERIFPFRPSPARRERDILERSSALLS
jgi:hypothetical protein